MRKNIPPIATVVFALAAVLAAGVDIAAGTEHHHPDLHVEGPDGKVGRLLHSEELAIQYIVNEDLQKEKPKE